MEPMYKHPRHSPKQHASLLEDDIIMARLESEVFASQPCFSVALKLAQKRKCKRIEELCYLTEFCNFADLLVEYMLTGRKPTSKILLEELMLLHPPQRIQQTIHPFSEPSIKQTLKNVEKYSS